MRIKGKYFWKKQWYSICSKHTSHYDNCKLCDVGKWENTWSLKISTYFHQNFYYLWSWWQNTRINKSRFNMKFENYKDTIKKERLKKLKKLKRWIFINKLKMITKRPKN